MANNTNPLPLSGNAISLQEIADAFYLYKTYTDGNATTIEDYYGDLIKQQFDYLPPSLPVPTTTERTINIGSFHGKQIILPINLTITTTVNNYNLFDNANAAALSKYGIGLTTADIPFYITLTNKSIITSTSISAPALDIGKSSDSTKIFNSRTVIFLYNDSTGTIVGATDTTPDRYFASDGTNGHATQTFTVNEGETSVRYNLAGAGGYGAGGAQTDWKAGYTYGGHGGNGELLTGSLAVSNNDIITLERATLKLNGTVAVAAGNGGSANGGNNGGSAGNGRGGGGGSGGGPNDGRGKNPSSGQPGAPAGGNVSYTPNLPGGPAIRLLFPVTVVNNGKITGGYGNQGIAGINGYSIVNKQYLLGGNIGGSGVVSGPYV